MFARCCRIFQQLRDFSPYFLPIVLRISQKSADEKERAREGDEIQILLKTSDIVEKLHMAAAIVHLPKLVFEVTVVKKSISSPFWSMNQRLTPSARQKPVSSNSLCTRSWKRTHSGLSEHERSAGGTMASGPGLFETLSLKREGCIFEVPTYLFSANIQNHSSKVIELLTLKRCRSV